MLSYRHQFPIAPHGRRTAAKIACHGFARRWQVVAGEQYLAAVRAYGAKLVGAEIVAASGALEMIEETFHDSYVARSPMGSSAPPPQINGIFSLDIYPGGG